ncbi:MAG: cell division ATP-binding protein FtsE [Clostridia bacterium]|nr:cell division ATP-binding protein FtsE [Clostridia bacterium]
MIKFQNVSKVYTNGTIALKNFDVEIGKGELVFIVGASGAGKSTFLKLIIREEAATSGNLWVNNKDLVTIKKREIPYLRRTMGIVFQDFRLINKMNVYDNIAFAMRIVGASNNEIKRRVPYILEVVGLKDKGKNFPNEISGGEQQRVGLARALVNNPSLIIADEPTGNIDPAMTSEVMELFKEINKVGTTILVVTHEHNLVREYGNRVITIDNGALVSDAYLKGHGGAKYER